MKAMMLQDYNSPRGYSLKKDTIIKVLEKPDRKTYIVITKEGHYWKVPKRLTQKAEE